MRDDEAPNNPFADRAVAAGGAVSGKLAAPRLGRVFARGRLFALLDDRADSPAVRIERAAGRREDCTRRDVAAATATSRQIAKFDIPLN